MAHMHVRGDLLVVTCENRRGRDGALGFNTQLMNWQTGNMVYDVCVIPVALRA